MTQQTPTQAPTSPTSQAQSPSTSPTLSQGVSPTPSPQPSSHASIIPVGTVAPGMGMGTVKPTYSVFIPSPLVIHTKLATPTLKSPADATQFDFTNSPTLGPIIFTWQPVTGATGYRLVEQYHQSGVWYNQKSVTVTACTYTEDNFAPGIDTFSGRWQVTALDSTGNHLTSDPSAWRTFTFALELAEPTEGLPHL